MMIVNNLEQEKLQYAFHFCSMAHSYWFFIFIITFRLNDISKVHKCMNGAYNFEVNPIF